MEADRLGVCEALGSKRLLLLVDTNFLIYMTTGIIAPTMILDAIERSHTIVICTQVINELEMLSERAPKLSTRRAATRALRLVESLGACRVSCPPGRDADDSILLAAIELSRRGVPVMIATCDRGLRRRARMHGIPTLYWRESESRLEAEWEPL